MTPVLLLFAASVSANFEGGSLARIEKVSPTHFRMARRKQS
jgi:hypothetical protein